MPAPPPPRHLTRPPPLQATPPCKSPIIARRVVLMESVLPADMYYKRQEISTTVWGSDWGVWGLIHTDSPPAPTTPPTPTALRARPINGRRQTNDKRASYYGCVFFHYTTQSDTGCGVSDSGVVCMPWW